MSAGSFSVKFAMASASIDRQVGSIIETDFVYNETSAEDGFRKFLDFAQTALKPSRTAFTKFPWLAFIASLVTDSHYDSDVMDRTLQGLYRAGQKLFDSVPSSPASPTRSRVAVVASRISDGKPCVFTNHRGVKPTVANPPYKVLLLQNGDQNPELWEM